MKIIFLIVIMVSMLLFSVGFVVGMKRHQMRHFHHCHERRVALRNAQAAYHDALGELGEKPSCAQKTRQVRALGHQYIALQREVHGHDTRHFNEETLRHDLQDLSSSPTTHIQDEHIS